jgi:hypothetical protein
MDRVATARSDQSCVSGVPGALGCIAPLLAAAAFGHVPGIDDRQRRLACAGRVHEFRLSNLCTNAIAPWLLERKYATSFNAASSSSPSLCRSMRRARCSMTKTMRKAAGKSSTPNSLGRCFSAPALISGLVRMRTGYR